MADKFEETDGKQSNNAMHFHRKRSLHSNIKSQVVVEAYIYINIYIYIFRKIIYKFLYLFTRKQLLSYYLLALFSFAFEIKNENFMIKYFSFILI
jgi:hypothetical protein